VGCVRGVFQQRRRENKNCWNNLVGGKWLVSADFHQMRGMQHFCWNKITKGRKRNGTSPACTHSGSVFVPTKSPKVPKLLELSEN